MDSESLYLHFPKVCVNVLVVVRYLINTHWLFIFQYN